MIILYFPIFLSRLNISFDPSFSSSFFFLIARRAFLFCVRFFSFASFILASMVTHTGACVRRVRGTVRVWITYATDGMQDGTGWYRTPFLGTHLGWILIARTHARTHARMHAHRESGWWKLAKICVPPPVKTENEREFRVIRDEI